MATVLFNLTASNSGNVGLETWVDLGLIPTGFDVWIGSASYTAVSKATSFDLRTNNTGQSAGSLAATTLLDTVTLKTGASITHDLYKRGTLHTKTVVGTGVEHWWLRVYSKSSTLGSYSYKILYTTE